MSLQFLIDDICANIKPEFLYALIETRLKDGSFHLNEVVPEIQAKDRSLDFESAKQIAEAALVEMVDRGELRVEGEFVVPAE